MSWYSKYLSVFEKPFDEASERVIDEIRNKINKKQSNSPIASVVVIAHNEETRLLSCLWSLADNKCKYPIEIIGVNNNSIDRTEDVFRTVGITPLFEGKKSPGYARQCGQAIAKGKYYICIDSDTMYPPYYIQTMINELEKPNIMAVYSLWSFIPNKEFTPIKLFAYELLRDIYIRLLSINRPERGVRGMVFAYRTEFGRKVGYRIELIRGEDGSMALGLKKYGKIKLITSRKARAVTASNTLNADGSLWNSFRVRTIKALKNPAFYFTKQNKPPKDETSNLIK
ncbi:glycosyltransferase family 2 protein [Massilibacteroides sp.]|uniref:glycosyltransferase family 2 protein n=1 Tax=Massilibacteroides sp. TaxID=2034766 RepID=UPI002630ACA2|nr:glycosyltransferase family 2 protein [Massilibacteroides sp.]MDD4514751.1 glycosyltransferase family 2 protein [Massilibacteroides sp.]